MPIAYGQEMPRDTRRYDQAKLKPEEAKTTELLLKSDITTILNRGFHPSYLLLLGLALTSEAEKQLIGHHNDKEKR